MRGKGWLGQEDGKDKDFKREIKNDFQVFGLRTAILLNKMAKAEGGTDLLGYQIKRKAE